MLLLDLTQYVLLILGQVIHHQLHTCEESLARHGIGAERVNRLLSRGYQALQRS